MVSSESDKLKKELRFSQKFLLIMLQLVNIMYILMLFMLQYIASDTITHLQLIPEDIMMLTLLFILFSGLSQILAYKLFIPRMKKQDDIDTAFTYAFNVLNTGGAIPSVLGVIIGIIGWASYNYVFWQISLSFILAGGLHNVTLYFYVIKPIFANFQTKK